MKNNQTHSEKISDEKKSIGFEYQYYFFLWKLLSLKIGESVGLEVKDDVHTDLDCDKQILYQVKHTIQNKKNDSPINLTSLNKDLWKTMSNWSQIITDKNDNRENRDDQLKFIEKTDFVLASNKSSSSDNKVQNAINNLKYHNTKISDLISVFEQLRNETSDLAIQGYINDVLSIDKDVLNNFMLHTSFELDENDLIKRCKDEIKADKIEENKIDDVFRKIDSSIREDNFIAVRNGEKIQISFDDFYKKYRRYYDLARNKKLIIKQYEGKLPNKLEDQTFIKQLIEIEDVQIDDFEMISKFTRFKLKYVNNLEDWLVNGEITQEEVDSLEKDSVIIWENKFRSIYRGQINQADFNSNGLKIIDYLRENKIQIENQVLDIDVSNGQIYKLSDLPKIGWRKDWEKYKK